ncbi:MAG: hypothetical protein KDI03_02965 [Anaerolineae bacterium]|nr:hypothetical protein [Anaerolineae bacterium]MCB0199008.1 hypothetical protein [Anaerolineae bacterium]MCB0204255.1 hypothetical protein [Anaerolineae bacterium]
MNKFTLERLLSRYSDYWSGTSLSVDDLSGLSPAARSELESVTRLVGLLHTTLMPVQPRDAFVEDLRRSLLADAIRRQSWRGVYLSPLRRHWKLTAAATASGVSAAAVSAVSAAIWYRGRSNM